jgi:hypothetical protein
VNLESKYASLAIGQVKYVFAISTLFFNNLDPLDVNIRDILELNIPTIMNLETSQVSA